MCGIAGIISLAQKSPHPETIKIMTDEMYRRGPDGDGYLLAGNDSYRDYFNSLVMDPDKTTKNFIFSSRSVLLGHRRLSIIDLSNAAAQPMSDITGKYWIVFNGEIYNHAEIRCELEAIGMRFKTDHSDTEVILNAYAAWGKNCIEKFRGMFAFVIWDIEKDTFFIVRDRLGVKPLYYTLIEDQFFFASELKALIKGVGKKCELNNESLMDYLVYTAVPAPRTIAKGFFKLPAAHYMYIKNGVVQEAERYWDPLQVEINSQSEKKIIAELKEILEVAVKYRTVADVPIGCLLSGGIDSTTNLAFLSKFQNKPVESFSIGFENKNGYQNELSYAYLASSVFNAKYHEILLNEHDFEEFSDTMFDSQDEPNTDTANIPIYFISKLAAENGIKVLLGGEGIDEILIGYEHWRLINDFSAFFNQVTKNIGISVYKWLHRLPLLAGKRVYYKDWVNRIERGIPVFVGGTELRTESAVNEILSHERKKQVNGYSSYDFIVNYYNEFLQYDRPYYDFMSGLDMNFRLPEQLLSRLDKMTMAASVEAREPFMDHKLVEFCMSIPAHMKVKQKNEKYLMKKAVEDVLPNEIVYRKKEGFIVPLQNLFKENDWGRKMRELIIQQNKQHNMFDDQKIQILLHSSSPKQLWNLYNICKWTQMYC